MSVTMKNDRRNKKDDNNKINDQIRNPFVLLIDDQGNNLGRTETRRAIKLAQEKGLDLVQVSFNKSENMPVCKVLDYGKLKYEKTKNKNKSNTSNIQQKEIKIGLMIAEHDLDIKINKMRKFLSKGTSVKYSLQLKGRQKGNKAAALDLFYNSLNKLEDCAEWDRPKVSDNNINVILHPKKS